MLRQVVFVSALMVGGISQAQTPGPATRGIVVHEPWSRATPGGARVGAGYGTIENRGATPDRLVGAEAEVSEGADLHETRTEGDVVRMVPTPSIDLAPGGRFELKPGGYHLMLNGLKRPLKEGERFTGTLVFEKAGRVPVTFQVRGIGAGAPASTHHH